jgi:hypothetical protein
MASSGTLPRQGHNNEQRGKHMHSLPLCLCMCVPLCVHICVRVRVCVCVRVLLAPAIVLLLGLKKSTLIPGCKLPIQEYNTCKLYNYHFSVYSGCLHSQFN